MTKEEKNSQKKFVTRCNAELNLHLFTKLVPIRKALREGVTQGKYRVHCDHTYLHYYQKCMYDVALSQAKNIVIS